MSNFLDGTEVNPYLERDKAMRDDLIVAMLALFVVFFLLEGAQELGLMHIDADVEHWK